MPWPSSCVACDEDGHGYADLKVRHETGRPECADEVVVGDVYDAIRDDTNCLQGAMMGA